MPDELKRIDLQISELKKPMKKGSYKGFSALIVILVLIPILIIGGLVIALMPLKTVANQAKIVMAAGKDAASALKSQDLDKTKSSLTETRKQMDLLKADYNKVIYLQNVPFLGKYISDGNHAIKAGYAGLDAADKAIAALEPNADLLGFKGGSKFVFGSADQRIQTAVKTMKALTPSINSMSGDIAIIQSEIDAIDPNRYPESFRGIVIRSTLISLKETIDNTANLFVNAQPLLLNLPNILGDPTYRRYMVLFQNDKELRSTGGFISAYGRFGLDKGKMVLEKADDVYALDAALTKKYPAPPEILKFHKDVFQLYIRDSNLSPDFKESMKTFKDMYSNVAGKENIDGIIAVDTHVLVEALKILGPMTINGREFSAETDKRCNCPKAVYELEDYSSRPVNYVRTERKDIIGILLQQLMQKALGVSPSQYWGKLFQMALNEINEKHILANFNNPDEQKAVENFNMAGRIMTVSETAPLLKYKEGNNWDYLHINNSNMAGAKSNMFVKETMLKDVTVNSDGTITTKLTINYKNDEPGSDCNLERGGLCLNAPLRNWVRVYVPLGSKLTDSKGSQSPKDSKAQPMDTYNSLGKTVFEGFLIVNPLGTARLDLTYTSPVKLNNGKYNILIQKQAGTDGDEMTIKLNGSEKKKFPLQTDTELEF
jgi:hypothetical protein